MFEKSLSPSDNPLSRDSVIYRRTGRSTRTIPLRDFRSYNETHKTSWQSGLVLFRVSLIRAYFTGFRTRSYRLLKIFPRIRRSRTRYAGASVGRLRFRTKSSQYRQYLPNDCPSSPHTCPRQEYVLFGRTTRERPRNPDIPSAGENSSFARYTRLIYVRRVRPPPPPSCVVA